MENFLILSLIEKQYADLTPRFQRIATYIMGNYKHLPLLSSAKLAEFACVSDASVIRFCQHIGFSGFLDFKKKLLSEINDNDNGYVDKITRAIRQFDENDKEYAQMLQAEVVNLQSTLAALDIQTLKNAAAALIKARKLFLIGFGSQLITPLLDFHFNRGGVDCEIITNSGVYLYEKILKITENDTVILTNFPRYSVDIISVLKHLKKIKAKTIIFTDDAENSISRMCDYIITSPCYNPLLPFQSNIGPVSACNALLFEYFKQSPGFSAEYIRKHTELGRFYLKK